MEEERSDVVEKYFMEFMKYVDESIKESSNIESGNVEIKKIRENEYSESYSTSKNILSKSYNLYQFYKENMELYNTRLILSLIYYGIFLILYYLSKRYIFIPFGYNFSIFSETILQLIFLTLAYFLVNTCSLNKVKEEMDYEINEYNNNLNFNNKKIERIYNNNTNSVISNILNSINNYIAYTKEFIPLLNSYITSLNKKVKCYRIIDNLVAFMSRYGMIGVININDIDNIRNMLPKLDEDKDILIYYISKISSFINIKNYIIELLYFDYIGDLENKNRMWQDIVNDYEKKLNLINILITYELLSTAIKNDEIKIKVIPKIKDFSLQKLQWGYTNTETFIGYINNALQTIKEENIIKENILNMYEYVFNSKIELFNTELKLEQQYEAIVDLCKNTIIEDYKNVDGLIEAFMVLISEKNMDWLLKISCITASNNDNSINILLKRMIMSENYDDKYITLKEVIDNNETNIIQQMEDRRHLKNQIKASLKDGMRIKSISNLIKFQLDRIEKRQIETEKKQEILEVKEKAIKLFAKNYLSQKTITQVLESKTLMAYIILFTRPEYGSVREDLENLKNMYHNKLWFENYTNSARLGLIPPNMTFLEISNIFYEYFKEKNINTNIVIHRFTLSEFNTTQIPLGDIHEPPWKILRRLIVNNLKPEQIRLYLRYGDLIEESFYNKSVYDIIKDYLDESVMNDKVEEVIKNKDILPMIYMEFKVQNMKELLKLMLNTKNDQIIKGKIDGVIKKEYSNINMTDDASMRNIGEELYMRLKSYAIISQELL